MNERIMFTEEAVSKKDKLLAFFESDRILQEILLGIRDKLKSSDKNERNWGACNLLYVARILQDMDNYKEKPDIVKCVNNYVNTFTLDPLNDKNHEEIFSLYTQIFNKKYKPADCHTKLIKFINYIYSGGTHSPRGDDLSRLAEGFIDSKYSGSLDKATPIQLRKILRECSHPFELMEIIKRGKAKDLGDLLECSEVDAGPSYTVLRKIDQKAFFDVYEGIDAASYNWAIKVPRKDIIEPFVKKMDISEYELLVKMGWNTPQNIEHKNISRINIHLGIKGKPFFVEELMDCTLEQLLSKGKLDYDSACRYFIHIASGLDAAHQKKRLHLDIKPNNLGYKEAHDRICIFDWGLSTYILDFYSEKLEIGGLLYRPREMFDKYLPSKSVDIYSMGVVAFEMFTGKHPVLFGSGYTPQDFPLREEREFCTEFIRDRIFSNKFYIESEEYLREHVKDEKLANCIVSCMSKEPNKRSSATEILYNLNHVA